MSPINSISAASKLVFFKAEKYEYEYTHTVDASNSPRPHFCMGLITEGSCVFRDCIEGEEIRITPGDIIFVPITSRYISKWSGSPKVSYISMHFIFDYPGVFSKQTNFKLQKVTPDDFAHTKEIFEYVLQNYNKDETAQLSALSKFYEILGTILPQLKTKKVKAADLRMDSAVAYIEQNYQRDITVEDIAGQCNMSVSRFFPCFKKSVGVTPVEYLNHYRVSRAIILLMNNDEASVESIGETVGFHSSVYFRRVFKKTTGKTPREYRKTAMEL